MLNKIIKKRIGYAVIITVIAAFVVYQIVVCALNGVITTEVAVSYTVYDEITTEALFFRDEQLINKTDDGIYNYTVSNGEKVAKSGTIAEVYADEKSAEARIMTDELTEKMNSLQAIQSTGANYFADIDLINSNINSDLYGILDLTDGRNLTGLSELSSDLIKQFNRKQINTGTVANFNDLISEISDEISNLSGYLTDPVSYVTSPESGFFVNYSDGYESIYTYDILDSVSVSELEGLFEAIPADSSSSVGKIITENKWYMAAVITSEEASYLKQGDSVTINIPQCSINDLSAKIEKIIDEEEKAAVILSCDTMTDNLVILRSEAIEIHANSYSGLRVSTRAIRVVEGIQGVYVLNKNEADFKPVNIIFSTVDYVICSTTDDNNSLILYDEIITEGSNLYDGKVVK